jgi:hypothetical protein
VLAKHVVCNGDRARDYGCLDPLTIIARGVAHAAEEKLLMSLEQV